MKNLVVARVLYKIADYLEIQEADFKPIAYRRAAQNIENLSEPIEDYAKNNKLEELTTLDDNPYVPNIITNAVGHKEKLKYQINKYLNNDLINIIC